MEDFVTQIDFSELEDGENIWPIHLIGPLA